MHLFEIFLTLLLVYKFANAIFYYNQVATPNAFPYVVFIYKDGNRRNRCGGALISKEYVLTAAQCVNGYGVNVILGAHNVNQQEYNQLKLRIPNKNVIIHESYVENGPYDIALIKLPNRVMFNNYIKKMELPSNDSELFVNERALFLSWGGSIPGIYPSQLQVMSARIISNSACRWFRPNLTNNEVCAKRSWIIHRSIFLYNGHAGGPLVVQKSNEAPVVVGIALSKNWFSKFKPSVFIRVSSFKDWIDSKTKGIPTESTSKTTTIRVPETTTKVPTQSSTYPTEHTDLTNTVSTQQEDTSNQPSSTNDVNIVSTTY